MDCLVSLSVTTECVSAYTPHTYTPSLGFTKPYSLLPLIDKFEAGVKHGGQHSVDLANRDRFAVRNLRRL